VKGAGVRNRIRARRARRIAQRAARRTRERQHELPRAHSLSEYAAAASGATTHVTIDRLGNISTVEVDPARFVAALARFDAHPHDRRLDDDPVDVPDGAGLDDDDDDDDSDRWLDGGWLDDAAGPGLAGADDDCPICRAIRESAIGAPHGRWSLDG